MVRSMSRSVLASVVVFALTQFAGTAGAQQIAPERHRVLEAEVAALRTRVSGLLLDASQKTTATASAVEWSPNGTFEGASWRLKKAAGLATLVAELKDGASVPQLKSIGLAAELATELDRLSGSIVVDLIAPDEESRQAAAAKVSSVYRTAMLILSKAVNSTATPLDVSQPIPAGSASPGDPGRTGAVKLLGVPQGAANVVPTGVPQGQPSAAPRPPGGFLPPSAPRIPGEPVIGRPPPDADR